MTRLRRRCRLALACLGAALLASQAPAFAREAEAPAVVRDLAYGEVLFSFYQRDYFTALTRLLAAQARNELPDHQDDAALLLGGMYLSYGQHRLAGEIFNRILEQSVAPEVHDRAWYFLARIWHQRGYLAEAEAALARIKGELPPELAAERHMLHAQLLMEQGRFEEALAVLGAWRRPEQEWVGFARYNVGVALVRLNRIDEGAAVLSEVGQLELDNPVLAPLRDKANVALGYAWLQAGRPLEAKAPLQRVRLEGPFSNKALLGVGWSDAELDDYRGALAPWMALRERSLFDSAVQESLLAVPYAFARLGASQQAADYYVDAIEAYDAEIERLDGSIAGIRGGRLLEELLSDSGADASGWYWKLEQPPDSPASRYLYELMASHRFQEGLKSYRDLEYLAANLARWTESLVVFDDILDTRQKAYTERLPLLRDNLAKLDLDALAARRVELESRLRAIEGGEDAVALATADEQALWRRLETVGARLRAVPPGDAAMDELRHKHRFLQGLLIWDLRRDYAARLWQEKKDLRDLDRQLKELQRRYHQVDRARAEWPEKFADLTTRIDGLAPRVGALAERVNGALSRQRAFLEELAVEELEARRARLATYIVQARFALASLYDQAGAQASTENPPGAQAP